MNHKTSILKNGYLIINKKVNFIIRIIDKIGYFLFKFRRKKFEFTKADNILLVIYGGFGDGLLFTAVLKSIRKNFPNGRIDVLTNKDIAKILENNPYIDNILISDIKWGYKYPLVIFNIIKTLKNKKIKYDLAVCFRAYFDNGILPVFLSAKASNMIGYKTGGFGFLLDKTVSWHEGMHETEHFLDLIKQICSNCNLNKPELFYDIKKTKAELLEILQKCGVLENDKFIIFHPASKDERKSLSYKQSIELIEKLLNNTDYKILVTGTDFDLRYFKEINIEDKRLIGLHDRINIFQLLELLKISKFIITVDTFIAHLAGISGTDTLVFWSGITDIKQWGPLGENIKIISTGENICVKWRECHRWCDSRNCMDFNIENSVKIILECL
jgi:ADP-heptose:LPS heptosyltransferase